MQQTLSRIILSLLSAVALLIGACSSASAAITPPTFAAAPDCPLTSSVSAAGTCVTTRILLAVVGNGQTYDTYSWNFGDGSPAGQGASQTHSYPAKGVYKVTLTVTLGGETASTSRDIEVALNPQSTFAITCDAKRLWCGFDASSAIASDDTATITSYAWRFGDGSTGTGAVLDHSYTALGRYAVELTTTDSKGRTGWTRKYAVLKDEQPPDNVPPQAYFDYLCIDTCMFDAKAATDSDGTIVKYQWNFGDGSSAEGKQAQHTYTGSGPYKATLTVTDDKGASNSFAKDVTPL
ncbi:PKD domain-containing protein [Nonomuraea insulae]|uniref:PKD domain-containing protein n=1 Tax=Nonomuraea insulae TaxID=1616787 RepID=A0ABW1CZY2_9ACTN